MFECTVDSKINKGDLLHVGRFMECRLIVCKNDTYMLTCYFPFNRQPLSTAQSVLLTGLPVYRIKGMCLGVNTFLCVLVFACNLLFKKSTG